MAELNGKRGSVNGGKRNQGLETKCDGQRVFGGEEGRVGQT